jgi:hypothetical protein
MSLSSLFNKKRQQADDNETRYIQSGSPSHPNNPITAVPAKPFTFQMTDGDNVVIDNKWLDDKWMRHPNAGPHSANALDDLIVDAAATQAASLHQQMFGESGHVGVIANICNLEPNYYHKLTDDQEELLKALECVIERINSTKI